jgi:hypothetical protein
MEDIRVSPNPVSDVCVLHPDQPYQNINIEVFQPEEKNSLDTILTMLPRVQSLYPIGRREYIF